MQKQKLKLQHLDSEALIKNSQVEGEVYLNKLNQKISILNTIKNQKNIKRLQTSLTNQILQEKTALQYYRKNKSFTLKNTSRLSKQNIIVYVININLTRTNTLITITDIKGNVKLFYSAGQVNLKGKQKTKQPTALINILKDLVNIWSIFGHVLGKLVTGLKGLPGGEISFATRPGTPGVLL